MTDTRTPAPSARTETTGDLEDRNPPQDNGSLQDGTLRRRWRRSDVVGRLTLPVPEGGRPALRIVENVTDDADEATRFRHRAREVAAETGACMGCHAFRELRPARVGVLVVIRHRPGCPVPEVLA